MHDTDEKLNFTKIADHDKITRAAVWKIYQRAKNPKPVRHRGKSRATDERTDRRIVRKFNENPLLTAPEIRDDLIPY